MVDGSFGCPYVSLTRIQGDVTRQGTMLTISMEGYDVGLVCFFQMIKQCG